MKILHALLTIAVSGTLFAGENVWTRIGPEGGAVSALAIDPRNPSILYAAAATGDIFKSLDGGASWQALGSPQNFGVGFLAIDSIGTVYAAAGLYGASVVGFSKSTDGGRSWSAIGPTLPSPCGGVFETLSIDPSNPGTLYAASAGVCKSIDGGATWTQLSSDFSGAAGFPPTKVLAVDPQTPQTIYANTSNRFFKSTDGGVSWNDAGSGLPSVNPPGPKMVSAYAVDPQNSGTVYLGLPGRIFKTTDGGASWNDSGTGLPQASTGYLAILSIAVNPRNPAAVYALVQQPGPSPVFVVTSIDGGATWTTSTDANPGAVSMSIGTITPDPQDPGTVYLGSGSGILKTTDGGGHWDFINSGLKAIGAGRILIDPRDGALLASLGGGAGGPSFCPGVCGWIRSTDGGANWSSTGQPPASPIPAPLSPGTLYALESPSYPSKDPVVLFKSPDFGENWAAAGTLPVSVSGYAYGLFLAPQFPAILYVEAFPTAGFSGSLLQSIDGGATWTQSTPALNGDVLLSGIAVDPHDPNTIYAGTGPLITGGITSYFSLSKSTDGGNTWTKLRGPDTITDSWGADPPSVVIDPQNSATIYFAEDDSWQKSTDGGVSWTDIPGCAYYSFLIDPHDSNLLYAAGLQQVCRSTDGGASWTNLESGLTGGVNFLALDPRNRGTLYAATSTGIFVITLRPTHPDHPQR